jgi:hypothetical protein
MDLFADFGSHSLKHDHIYIVDMVGDDEEKALPLKKTRK